MEEQTKLLTSVAKLLPTDTRIVLMADREYGSLGLFEFLQQQGWFFVIRMFSTLPFNVCVSSST